MFSDHNDIKALSHTALESYMYEHGKRLERLEANLRLNGVRPSQQKNEGVHRPPVFKVYMQRSSDYEAESLDDPYSDALTDLGPLPGRDNSAAERKIALLEYQRKNGINPLLQKSISKSFLGYRKVCHIVKSYCITNELKLIIGRGY